MTITRHMKWLITRTSNPDSLQLYLKWTADRGVTADLIDAGDPIPSDLRQYDAILLTGGGDVDPVLYDEPRHHETTFIKRERDDLELNLIKLFMDDRKPLFGICRGIQVINVALGGKLIQHVPDVLSGNRRRVTPPSGSVFPEGRAPRARRLTRSSKASEIRDGEHHSATASAITHGLIFNGTSPLSEAMRGASTVNSFHHQSVDPDHIGQGLRVTASSPAGIIEAVDSGGGLQSQILAVQWHPERLPPGDPASDKLLELMISIVSIASH